MRNQARWLSDGKSIPDGKKQQVQRPRGRTWMEYSRSKGVTAAEEGDELRGGSISVEGSRPQIVEDLEGCCKNSDFDSEWTRRLWRFWAEDWHVLEFVTSRSFQWSSLLLDGRNTLSCDFLCFSQARTSALVFKVFASSCPVASQRLGTVEQHPFTIIFLLPLKASPCLLLFSVLYFLLWGNGGIIVLWKFLMFIKSCKVLWLILPNGQPLLTQILTLLQLRPTSSPTLVPLLSWRSNRGWEVSDLHVGELQPGSWLFTSLLSTY